VADPNSDQARNLLTSSRLRILDAHGDRDALVKTANLVLALEAELPRVFGSKPNEATSALQHERAAWPAPGSEDTELGVLMELEVRHGETEVYP
jgi:hypothetical protein